MYRLDSPSSFTALCCIFTTHLQPVQQISRKLFCHLKAEVYLHFSWCKYATWFCKDLKWLPKKHSQSFCRIFGALTISLADRECLHQKGSCPLEKVATSPALVQTQNKSLQGLTTERVGCTYQPSALHVHTQIVPRTSTVNQL